MEQHLSPVPFLLYYFFFFKIFFLDVDILKVIIEFVNNIVCFVFRFFGCKSCEILAPSSGIKPAPPVMGGEALTHGSPGKYLL